MFCKYTANLQEKLQSNFIEITLQNRCSPVNLLYIFRTPFPKNTSEQLLSESVFNTQWKKEGTSDKNRIHV